MNELFLKIFNIQPFEINPLYVRDYLKEDPNAQDHNGHTVLHKYVLNCRFDAGEMQSLINKRANLELRNCTGKTAFLLAVVLRQKDMIDMLIENGTDIQVQDNVGNNALHYLAIPELSYDYMHISNPRFTIEHIYEILEKLLKRGINVNAVNQDNATPLMWAARGCDLKIVQTLLKFGANVNLQDKKGFTCLHFAAYYGAIVSINEFQKTLAKFKILTELLLSKACVNCFNVLDCTAFYNIFLSIDGYKYFVRKLLKATALANWNRKIVVHLTKTRVLGAKEDEEEEVKYFDYCYLELDCMQDYTLPGGYNLCDFARGGVSEDELKKTPEIKDEVLKILVKEHFPFYEEFLLKKLGKPYLCEKVANLDVFARKENKAVRLHNEILYEITSFLKKKEILNLLSAFSEQLYHNHGNSDLNCIKTNEM